MSLRPDACGSTNANLSKANCLITPKETKRLLFSPDLNYKLELATLADEATLKAEIAAGKLFLTPDFYDVRNSTINGVQIAQDNSGNSQVTRLSSNFNIEFGIKIGQCMLKKAQAWNDRQVQVWAVSEANEVEGYLAEDVTYLKGVTSKLVFSPSRPRRVNNTDIVYPSMIWLVDKDTINHAEPTTIEFTSIDGIVDVSIAITSAAAASVVIKITEGCNGTGVEGFEANDLVYKDSTGATEVPTSVTDNGNGTYTAAFSPSLSTGTYSVNLSDETIEITGSTAIYGALSVAKTFTIS